MELLYLDPAWRFAARSYYPLKSDPTKIACCYTKDGKCIISNIADYCAISHMT